MSDQPGNPTTNLPPAPPSTYLCPNQNPDSQFYAHPYCYRFYEQLENVLIDRACPQGYEWNPRDNCCDEPENSRCIHGQAPHRPDAIPESEFSTTTEASQTTTTPDHHNENYKCPNDFPSTQFYPHPYCDYFYEIDEDTIIERECPPGNHWNAIDSCCDEPDNARCIYGEAPWRPSIPEQGITTEPTSIETTTELATTLHMGDDNLDNYLCSNVRPSASHLHPHPNCERFYEIRFDITFEMICPRNLHWNRNEHCCDAPSNANCIYGMAPVRPDAIATVNNDWYVTQKSTVNPSTEENEIFHCTNENPTVEVFPHPNCELYYKIEFGLTYEAHCTNGTHFNTRYNCCEDPKISNCVYGLAPLRPEAIAITTTVPIVTSSEEPNYICPNSNSEGTYFSHPNCGRFYEVRLGTTYEMLCPEGYHWNRFQNCCGHFATSNCIFGLAPPRPGAILL